MMSPISVIFIVIFLYVSLIVTYELVVVVVGERSDLETQKANFYYILHVTVWSVL